MRIEVAQGVVYRFNNGNLEFLILKRVVQDGGFWQAVTGTLNHNESAREALLRELEEEAGIINPLHVSKRLEEYYWEIKDKNISGKDNVFGVEVAAETKIKIDPNEHSEFRWVNLEEASKLLKYEGNRLSMIKVSEYAMELH